MSRKGFALALVHLLVWGWALVSVAEAHDPGLSAGRVTVGSTGLVVTLTLAESDAEAVIGAEGPAIADSGALPEDALSAWAPHWWGLQHDEADWPVESAEVHRLPGREVVIETRYAWPSGAPRSGAMSVTLTFLPWDQLPPGHRCFVVVIDAAGQPLKETLLERTYPTIAFTVGPPASAGRVSLAPLAEGRGEAPAGPSLLDFLKLGVEHILTGYDHLLFLLGLLVVCSRVRPTLAIITSFTVGHSITLICATFGWINLPSHLVEPLIAASIVYVGVENLVRRGKAPHGRWALTLGFGLVHGFGFAGVLRDLGIGSGGSAVVGPLVGFNLGVELGQIGVALIVLPLLWQLRKRPAFVARGVPILSALVALAGMYWLIERVVG